MFTNLKYNSCVVARRLTSLSPPAGSPPAVAELSGHPEGRRLTPPLHLHRRPNALHTNQTLPQFVCERHFVWDCILICTSSGAITQGTLYSILYRVLYLVYHPVEYRYWVRYRYYTCTLLGTESSQQPFSS